MPANFFPPLVRNKVLFPGQWGVQGSDNSLGFRDATRATVFYVDSGHAQTNNNNDGTDPDFPLQTVTNALSKATTNANDYIVVRQMTNALETFPITITKNRVHLISAFYDFGKGPEIRPVADTAGVLLNADNVEIAGFDITAGNTHGCIEASITAATWGADIHHCRFGWQALTPRDGINMEGLVDKPHWVIHDNWFNDKITRDGIRIQQNSTRSVIWNNVFRGIPNGGIHIDLLQFCNDIFAIHDNWFHGGAVQGDSITFASAASANCMVYNNYAMSIGAIPAANPFVDAGTNDWGLNYMGTTATYPV